GLPTGDQEMPEEWWDFHDTVANAQTLDVARFVRAGTRRELPAAVCAAYDAPFPDETYKAGPSAMTSPVPPNPAAPAWDVYRYAGAKRSMMDSPFLCAFADGDPITGSMKSVLLRTMRGAQELDHPVIVDAGHFLQEDAGERLAGVVVDFVARRVVAG